MTYVHNVNNPSDLESSIISCLFIENDIPTTIFSHLPPADLFNAELVCNLWKTFIIEEKLWEKKLNLLYFSDISWQNLLDQYSWKNQPLSHASCKCLYLNILAKLGPSQISVSFAKFILNDFIYDQQNPLMFKDFEENVYLTAGVVKDRKPLVEIARNNMMFFNEGFRELVLTGPTSFPVIVTPKSIVVVAGATYGKGRVVVMGHEALLKETTFIQHMADWCGRCDNCPIAEDVKQGFWRDGWQTRPSIIREPRKPLSRKNLDNSIPVFITDAHHDDECESLMEYVKQGGGLIIAGHACWQLSQLPNHCDLLEHPGNRIIAPMGIVFSSSYVSVSALNLARGTLPGLKYSLYYVVKCIARLGLPLVKSFITSSEYRNLSNQVREIVMWQEQLSTVEWFKDLLMILNYYEYQY